MNINNNRANLSKFQAGNLYANSQQQKANAQKNEQISFNKLEGDLFEIRKRDDNNGNVCYTNESGENKGGKKVGILGTLVGLVVGPIVGIAIGAAVAAVATGVQYVVKKVGDLFDGSKTEPEPNNNNDNNNNQGNDNTQGGQKTGN